MNREFEVQIGARLQIRAKDKEDAICKVRAALNVYMNLIELSSNGVIAKEPFWVVNEL